jgi:hypothetical protein
MNGIGTNAILTEHELARCIDNDEIKEKMTPVRRSESMQQQAVERMNPQNPSILLFLPFPFIAGQGPRSPLVAKSR